ncbi:capsule polysaccharide export inner-membrane protein KpsE [Thiomicrorhabdus immobilis]|uniref:Capsule polysaccharide export inner-membrane protein KpsE n=1 Tax=Thiomicrorhabdus immobilis TaxID=2791037 RepID=A0ABM7MBL9_9GAMM|nr:hypothetical protein [Thiomicrorhabdus immobilis]BCN92738.1 capsule polysaccharide export inner-membrane protein KpsE [Thiomicrorhabdus immobilis]
MKNYKQILKKYPIWFLSLVIAILISVYWSFFATDRYVSTAHIVLQTPDVAPPELSFSSLMTGTSTSNKSDLLLLRDFLLSTDMLKALDAELDLRSHFSDETIDYFSRMREANLPIEYFHDYYLRRINIELDDYAGVLVVKSSAFKPEVAKAITDRLLKYGEQHMNQMGQKLAADQVSFIEKQVEKLNQNLQLIRIKVLAYQDDNELISPTSTVESYSGIISQLRTDLAGLYTQKSVLGNFQSQRSPEMIKLNSQIKALQKQIAIENSKLTAKQGQSLNKVSAEYETLLLQERFAQELYSNALATLEGTRVEAARKLKQVSVTQTAAIPEYPIEPNRLYNITVTILLLLLVTIILSMIYEIIRDHRD